MEKKEKTNWWKVSTFGLLVIVAMLAVSQYYVYSYQSLILDELEITNKWGKNGWNAYFRERESRQMDERATIVLAKVVLRISETTNTNIRIANTIPLWEYPTEIIEKIHYNAFVSGNVRNVNKAVDNMVNNITNRFGIEIFDKPILYQMSHTDGVLTVGVYDLSRVVHVDPLRKVGYIVGLEIDLTHQD